MKTFRLVLLGLAPIATLAACSGGGSSGSQGNMDLVVAANGFGEVLPHKVIRLGSDPAQEIAITSRQILLDNVVEGNPILPPARFQSGAVLPTGEPGNHFFYARFTQALDVDSVLSRSPGDQANAGLTGAVTLVRIDTATGNLVPVPARVFVNGQTYAGTPEVDPGTGELVVPRQTWVTLDDSGRPVVNADIDNDDDGNPDGLGFPGTEGTFAGMSDLVSPNAIVFVADSDGDLSSHEQFPSGSTLRLQITTGVLSQGGERLARQAAAVTTVGPDTTPPEVRTTPGPAQLPDITPGQGQTGVDPMTNVRIRFTEPVQPLTVGSLPSSQSPLLSAAVEIAFGPDTARVVVPFTAEPRSVFDLTEFDLVPLFNFPGEGPTNLQCGVFNEVDVTTKVGLIADLAGQLNVLSSQTSFETGEGPGVVNVPVTPDVIYVARGGAVPGLSVVDLNGFGGGTGNPTFDPQHPILQGNSNYPNNPNVALNGPFLIPTLTPGVCTLNGGSEGVFTLARDSSLGDKVLRAPLVSSIGDMMLGWSLDGTFNNGPFPFGCQANGGNLCAFDGKKLVSAVANVRSMAPVQAGQFGTLGAGAPNLVCWAPHPNPPPLNFPPLCVSPYLPALEPTSVDTIGNPNAPATGITNLLLPGNNPQGTPVSGIPPSTLLTPEQNSYFQGPSAPMPGAPPSACSDYMIRQQVGHFLYVIDRARSEIVVLNSNRMTVVDRISTPDPTTLAMSPNLDLMGVTNQTADSVSFIDINPGSANFHQIVQTVSVGRRPRGICWQPDNEDILVVSEADNSLSILSALSLQVRRVVRTNLDRPFDIVSTPRQLVQYPGFGFQRDVYYAWILNRSGRVGLFESGPSGINGWGYDDVIGVSTEVFRNPKTLQPDYINLSGSVWIVHEGPIDELTGQSGPEGVGAISNFGILSGNVGRQPLNSIGFFTSPNIRDVQLGVIASLGQGSFGLSGIPVEIAFDNQRNLTGLPNLFGPFSAGFAQPANGKGMVKINGAITNTTTPQFMFAAVPNPVQSTGVVDVISLTGSLTRRDTNAFVAGVQSIPAPNVQGLMDYFRQ